MTPSRKSRGFSLIELLVSMAIGLVLTAAIASVMVSSESDKRGSTAVGDMNQSGSYAAYLLDRQIRSAGSGFAQAWPTLVGCKIYAQSSQNTSGSSVLPRSFPAATGTTPSPFAGWNTTTVPIALAPVVIGNGMGVRGDDLLMVMSGTGAFNEVPTPVLPGVTSSTVRLNNTVGFRTGDLVLIADPAVPGQCVVQQVNFGSGSGSGSGGATQSLPLGNTTAGGYAGAVPGGPALSTFGVTSTAVLAQIGNYDGNMPQFTLYGVDDKNSLVATDLLPSPGTPDDTGTAQTIADDVVMMKALYGTVPYPYLAGSPITWVSPSTTGYTAAELLPSAAGSIPAAQQRLHGIVAIRLGLVLRSATSEQKPVSGVAPTLFSDLSGLSVAGPALTGPPYYRYRTVELTIPLRNVLMAP